MIQRAKGLSCYKDFEVKLTKPQEENWTIITRQLKQYYRNPSLYQLIYEVISSVRAKILCCKITVCSATLRKAKQSNVIQRQAGKQRMHNFTSDLSKNSLTNPVYFF